MSFYAFTTVKPKIVSYNSPHCKLLSDQLTYGWAVDIHKCLGFGPVNNIHILTVPCSNLYEQHYKSYQFKSLFRKFGVDVCLLDAGLKIFFLILYKRFSPT